MPAQRGSRQCEGGEPALRKATCRNDLREALAALYDGAVHGRDRSGKGALHYAAERGYLRALPALAAWPRPEHTGWRRL